MDVKKEDISMHLRSLTDSELAELEKGELTDDGRLALVEELKWRQSPEYLAKEEAKNLQFQAEQETNEYIRSRIKKAKRYALIATIFVGMPILLYLNYTYLNPLDHQELTIEGNRNLRLRQMELDKMELSQEDRKFLAETERGRKMSKDFVNNTLAFAGGIPLMYVFFNIAIRGGLYFTSRKKE